MQSSGSATGDGVALQNIVGELISESHRDVEDVGDIHYQIHVTKQESRSGHRLMVGSTGPVYTWDEFIAAFLEDERYQAIAKELDATLGHTHIIGLIDVPDANTYVTEDRRAFSKSLLDDTKLCNALFNHLKTFLAPRVQESIKALVQLFARN